MNTVNTAASAKSEKIVELRNSQNQVQSSNTVLSMDLSSATPMIRQYLEIKQQHADYLLFYRMGDFYELFFDDALKAAGVLDIALTKRGQHKGADIPMCGVPFHSAEAYLEKLIKHGFKVAICEQMEAPEEAKKRGHKAVVRREVIRIITPGTITEENLLEARQANYLCALTSYKNSYAIAWVDISTGEFLVSSVDGKSLESELARISPKEVLAPDKLLEDQAVKAALSNYKSCLTTYSQSFFEPTKAERKIKSYYDVVAVESFGSFDKAQLAASGALLEYVDLTQKGNMPNLNFPKVFTKSEYLVIDAATAKNLEIFRTLSGEYKGSLLSVIDKTLTNSGARLLRSYLAAPLINPEAINKRLDVVEFFLRYEKLTGNIQDSLSQTQDIERALSRIFMNRGGPRDLLVIREGLIQAMQIVADLELNDYDMPEEVRKNVAELGNHTELIGKLKKALEDEVPNLAREGGFIRQGYNATLDNYLEIRENSQELKHDLRDKYRADTGISSLKIGENNLIGFYIEVTSTHLSKVPCYFTHRQTMQNGIRYSTTELKDIENKILNAKALALKLELELFDELVSEVLDRAAEIGKTAQAMAKFDVFTSFAELAKEYDYTRPKVDNSLHFQIKRGRHPVVEEALKLQGKDIIANDCYLGCHPSNTSASRGEEKLWVLTGPNMAGKSTFLRQNALIAILAQIGSYVPAEHVHIGMIDKIFSRVGASDDIAKGHSTFMVEMLETASILNNSTARSLVILDEIGRGTATYDGLSIAWAVLEHLHDINKCRGLFATHYHELTGLCDKLESLGCYSMKVSEWEDKIVFLYEVQHGAADRSYGVQVAKLAGLPKVVTDRATQILHSLQNAKSGKNAKNIAEKLPLFKDEAESFKSKKLEEIDVVLTSINADNIAPREALEYIYKLKEIIENRI